jgi:hypothetical protein
MFYKALGFVVWKGAKWYVVRKTTRRKAPQRDAILATALAIGAAAANEARR